MGVREVSPGKARSDDQVGNGSGRDRGLGKRQQRRLWLPEHGRFDFVAHVDTPITEIQTGECGPDRPQPGEVGDLFRQFTFARKERRHGSFFGVFAMEPSQRIHETGSADFGPSGYRLGCPGIFDPSRHAQRT